jgi:hypothetical protein
VRKEPECAVKRFATAEEAKLMTLVLEGRAKTKDKRRLKDMLAGG